MHLLRYVKIYTALSMEFIVGFFPFFSKRCICGFMVWIILASISVLRHLHSLLSVELNRERSSTSLTSGKSSNYLNNPHVFPEKNMIKIVHYYLEKMLVTY